MKINKTTITGLILFTAGVAPILLYGIFGPSNGNPIGLGLLFIFLTPIGVILIIIGILIAIKNAK